MDEIISTDLLRRALAELEDDTGVRVDALNDVYRVLVEWRAEICHWDPDGPQPFPRAGTIIEFLTRLNLSALRFGGSVYKKLCYDWVSEQLAAIDACIDDEDTEKQLERAKIFLQTWIAIRDSVEKQLPC